jgi:hypothetical protein
MKWKVGLSVMAAVAVGWVAIAMIPAATIATDDSSFKFLPPDTRGIAVFDVAALKEAQLFQDSMKDQNPTFPRGFLEFMAASGFDPKRDVDKVTIGKLGAKDGLVIVQGSIDKFKVEQFMRDKGKPTEAYLGHTLYRDGEGAFLVLDNTVVMGPLNAVKRAVDQMQLPGSQPLPADLSAAMKTIEAGNQIWAVGDFSADDLRTVGIRGPAPAVQMLKSLNSGTYQMRVDTGVRARAVATFADAESAKNLADLGRGAVAVAKLQVAKRQPDILHALDGIQISNSGSTVTVIVEESGDLVKKVQEALKPALDKHLRVN